MTRYVSAAGTGLQLWQVDRLYVEWYSTWPSATPVAVWSHQVTAYELPCGPLGACLDGRLTARGVTAFQPFSALARVVAVVGADEYVIYTGVAGLSQQGSAGEISVQLLGPDAILRDAYTDTPLSSAPYAGVRTYGSYSVPAEQLSPHTTHAEYWQAALAAYPDASIGVGPDLHWVIGRPSLVPAGQRLSYTPDHRAVDRQSLGAEVPPYLTHIRRYVEGGGAAVTSSRSVGLFVPRRVADVGGQIITEVTEGTSAWGVSNWQGPVGYIAQVDTMGFAPAPAPGQTILSIRVRYVLNLTMYAGAVTIEARTYVVQGGSNRTLRQQRYEATQSGSWVFEMEFEGAEAVPGAELHAFLGVRGINSTNPDATATITRTEPTYRYTQTTQRTEYGADPPGLGYPTVTAAGSTMRLPGVHRGPLLVGGQYATGVTRADAQGGVWTEIRTNPLPYQLAPMLATPTAGGARFTRRTGKGRT